MLSLPRKRQLNRSVEPAVGVGRPARLQADELGRRAIDADPDLLRDRRVGPINRARTLDQRLRRERGVSDSRTGACQAAYHVHWRDTLAPVYQRWQASLLIGVSQLWLIDLCAAAASGNASTSAHHQHQSDALAHRNCPFIARDATDTIDPLASTSASSAPAARMTNFDDDSAVVWSPGRRALMRMMELARAAVSSGVERGAASSRCGDARGLAWPSSLAAPTRTAAAQVRGHAVASVPGARGAAARRAPACPALLPGPGRALPPGPGGRRRAAALQRRPRRPIRRARLARARWQTASPSLVCRFRPAERSPRKVRCQRALRMTRKPIVLGAERLPAASTARRRASKVPGRSRRARILARNRLSFAPADPNCVNSPTDR